MADRYWILGTGSWSSTNTANWSASSGGAGGASVPTAADNVFFDANSNVGTGAFTVTMANTPRVCNDFTASGLDGTMTLAGASIALNVSGSLTWPATGFIRTYNGVTTFNATTTGKTVSTQNIAFGTSIEFAGVGGGWTLGSALNVSNGFLNLTNGTLNTSASNYAITTIQLSSSNSNTRTLNLNGSTVTITGTGTSGWTTSTITNLTFNAGTSSIVNVGASTFFNGGGLTFYDVSFTNAAVTSVSIFGSNTYRNLSITGRIILGLGTFFLSGDQTINGTLTIGAGTGAAYRTMITSDFFSFVGYNRTMTCAAVSLTDVDFRGITVTGAASPISGTRLGNCAGNTNINFPAAKTVYYRLTGSNDWGTSGSGSWSATSGGVLDATQFPLAQDTAVFPAATYPASGSTTTINGNYNIGTIDMSLRTSNTMTLGTATNSPSIYGNWINGTGTTISGASGTITFAGRTTQTITSAGRPFTQPITVNSPSGTVTLQDSLTTAITAVTQLTVGTLNLQSYTLSTGAFSSSNSNIRTIAFGTGQINCIATGTIWNTGLATNLTTTGTQVVNLTSTATGVTPVTVSSGALNEANSISYNFTGGSYIINILTATGNTLRNLNFTGFSGSVNTFFPSTIFGNLTCSSTMTLPNTANAVTFGATSGTQLITTNGRLIRFNVAFNGVGGTFRLQDALTMDTNRNATLTNGTLDLNGQTLTVGTTFATAAGTKNLTFNGGTLVCPAASATAFNNASPTNFTTTAGTGTGTISMTAASAKFFAGGGSTFNCTLNQGGAGALTIISSNTFSNITNTVQPASVLFTAATTNTFTNFSLSGTSGNLITIDSSTSASHTLSKASGTVSVSFCSISRSSAIGGATWEALTTNGNVNGGNNTGWFFGATSTGNFLVFF